MNYEEHIRALSLRVTTAPEGSEEFKVAIDELRAALKASVDRGRARIAELQSVLPRSRT
jgi:hypothetical protein